MGVAGHVFNVLASLKNRHVKNVPHESGTSVGNVMVGCHEELSRPQIAAEEDFYSRRG